MGCDIHTLVEYKKSNKWKQSKIEAFSDSYNDGKLSIDADEQRNYMLYSFLADVRNYHHERIEPIKENEGVPDDSSTEWKKKVEEWDADMHSQTFYTLKELTKIDLSTPINYGTYFYREDYERYKSRGRIPDMSYRGSNMKDVTEEEYSKMSNEEKATVHGVYTVYTRPISYWVNSWFDSTIAGLARVAEHYSVNTDEVRVMIGFDN